MAIDWSSIAAHGGIPKNGGRPPRVLATQQKQTEHDRKLAAAYAIVDARENNICQLSGAQLSPTSSDPKRRREHHHLKGRNVKPEWIYEPRRIALVSAHVHSLITSGAILIAGTDATKPLKASWNRQIVKRLPMRLESVS
jgi:hypothetical protein